MAKRSKRRSQSNRSDNDIEKLVAQRVQQELAKQTVQRASRVQNALVQAGAPANIQPVSDELLAQMYLAMAPQDPSTATPFYSPGAPIRPIPQITPPDGPRIWSYPVGQNISTVPRGNEEYSFAELRSLANLYDGIQLCEQVLLDYIDRLELVIEPKPELLTESLDLSTFQPSIDTYTDFFEFPDKYHDLKSWMRMALRDQLEIDAVAVYVHPSRSGGVYSLELLDGATIKPLLDDRGRTPQPPFPAYEQFLYGGTPAELLTTDQLLYIKETPRTNSEYGRSRVERIILRVNQALRKQSRDLARFTDGTVPNGIVEVPMDLGWTQDQLEEFEYNFNALMSGNDQARAKLKLLPKGMHYIPTIDLGIDPSFDSWLLNVTVAAFGLTMAELGMTEDVNKSSGETQENVAIRRALKPLISKYERLFTHILRKYFNENRFLVRFKGFEEVEDFQAQASAYSTLVNAGILSPSRAAHLMHLPVDIDLPSPIVPTKNGPMLLEDLVSPDVRSALKQTMVTASQPKPAPSKGGQSDDKTTGEDDEGDETPTRAEQIREEFRKWKNCALNDVKRGKQVRSFKSDILDSSLIHSLSEQLHLCQTPEEVRAVFARY